MDIKKLGYIDHGNGQHQSNTVYDTSGMAPSITTLQGGTQQIKIMDEKKSGIIVVGQMDNSDGTLESANRVYSTASVSPCLNTCGGGGREPKILAMRGRNPDNPKSRKKGIPLEQTAEIKEENMSNTLTQVQKDNMLLDVQYRIRKLTARECWRLMAFTDEEYDKAAAVTCQSQLYKQAGNSIVVDVLTALFSEIVSAAETTKDHSGEQITIFDLLGEE